MEEAFSNLDHMTAVIAGLGLSAAAGFRVFVPLLIMGIAGRNGMIPVAESFEWATSIPALLVFGTATVAEIASYYIPWVDNLLDTVASPLAVGSGTVITAAMLPEMSDALQWGLAGVLGGGSAAVVQAGTVLTRGASTATTGGLGNPVVSTTETVGAIVTGILAVAIPIVVGIVVIALFVWAIRKIIARFRAKPVGARKRLQASCFYLAKNLGVR